MQDVCTPLMTAVRVDNVVVVRTLVSGDFANKNNSKNDLPMRIDVLRFFFPSEVSRSPGCRCSELP